MCHKPRALPQRLLADGRIPISGIKNGHRELIEANTQKHCDVKAETAVPTAMGPHQLLVDVHSCVAIHGPEVQMYPVLPPKTFASRVEKVPQTKN